MLSPPPVEDCLELLVELDEPPELLLVVVETLLLVLIPFDHPLFSPVLLLWLTDELEFSPFVQLFDFDVPSELPSCKLYFAKGLTIV